jgi:DnaK suppressor protein
MSDRKLEDLLEILVQEREQIRATLLWLHDSGQPVELDQTTQGRLSRADAMTQQSMAKAGATRLATQLQRIEAALGRFESNRYGVCCRCGEEIAHARLAADPATPFCIDCTEEIARDRQDDLRRDAGR